MSDTAAIDSSLSNTSVAVRYVRGQMPLWFVFWVGYVLAGFALGTLFAIAVAFGLKVAPLHPLMQHNLPIAMTIGVAYLAFTYIIMWKSAWNVSRRIFGYLVRIWIIGHTLYLMPRYVLLMAGVFGLIHP